MRLRPFHLAIPVKDLQETRTFYTETLGLAEGRSTDSWVDLNFFGHQVVIHLGGEGAVFRNEVDAHSIPVPHFGVILDWEDWESLAASLKKKQMKFIVDPYIRFAGLPGEQATLFIQDPSGNVLEFKAFKSDESIFKKQ